MLRRLIKASAIVAGTGLAVAGCAVTPLKMGAAAVVGDQRISIATLDSQVTNLSQAAAKYPGVVTLTPVQRTQATLTWLIRYQITEELARQQGITISSAQGQKALSDAITQAEASAAQQGLTNATQTLILAASGIPPDTSAELGRYEAISGQYLIMANGGTAPATGSAAATAATSKLSHAECLAAKALNISVNPQFGQLDYTAVQIVPASVTVTRSAGPMPSTAASLWRSRYQLINGSVELAYSSRRRRIESSVSSSRWTSSPPQLSQMLPRRAGLSMPKILRSSVSSPAS